MRSTRSSGFALVIVLWSVGGLALLGSQLTATARTQLRLAAADRDTAVAEAAADGAIAQATFRLLAGARADPPGPPARARIGDAVLEVVTEDQAFKINPNAVPMEVLRDMLAEVGVDRPRAARIAGQIADWRNPGRVSVLGGMKIDQYRDRGLPYRSGDRAFSSVDELGLVPDMTGDVLNRLRPWLSVFQEGKIDDSGAGTPVRSVLGDARISSRGAPDPGFVSANRVVRITARAIVRGRARFVRSAVVRLRANAADGHAMAQVLTWEQVSGNQIADP